MIRYNISSTGTLREHETGSLVKYEDIFYLKSCDNCLNNIKTGTGNFRCVKFYTCHNKSNWIDKHE